MIQTGAVQAPLVFLGCRGGQSQDPGAFCFDSIGIPIRGSKPRPETAGPERKDLVAAAAG